MNNERVDYKDQKVWTHSQCCQPGKWVQKMETSNSEPGATYARQLKFCRRTLASWYACSSLLRASHTLAKAEKCQTHGSVKSSGEPPNNIS